VHQTPIPQPPQRVVVSSSAADREAAEAFKEMLKVWDRTLRDSLKEGQDLILEYHTPAGERIIVNNVTHVVDTDIMILQGYGVREEGLCQMLVRAPNLHAMFRIVALPDEAAERRPTIGFVSVYQQGEQSKEE
jgi:hypothetical protein